MLEEGAGGEGGMREQLQHLCVCVWNVCRGEVWGCGCMCMCVWGDVCEWVGTCAHACAHTCEREGLLYKDF